MNSATTLLVALALAQSGAPAKKGATAAKQPAAAAPAAASARQPAAAAPAAAKPTLTPAAIAKFKLKPGAAGAICLDCHGGFQKTLSQAVVHTPVRSRDCIGCHSPHASDHGKLLAAEPGAVCGTCHSAIVPAKARSTHRPIAEKGCLACHDAHASANKAVLVKPQTDLCASCHKELVAGTAKAKYKHKPVEATGCSTCHDPHGSEQADHLLKTAVPALCVGCHKTTTPIFSKAHLNYPVAQSDCTSCHDPHGSSVRGMLWDRVHPPVAKLMCGACHDAPTAPNPLVPKQVAPGLCRSCHAEKLVAMLGQNRVHQPVLEGRSCLTCHGPHASKVKGLLRGPPLTVCGSCHADTTRRNENSSTKHKPVADGDCAACHDPHASAGALLLVNADRIAMCGKCHDWATHSTHPIGEKRIDPRNKNLRVECLSCHRAHGTEFPKLLLAAKQSELCTKCHTSYVR